MYRQATRKIETPMLYEIHIKVLILIIVANAAPIIARFVFRSHFNDPLDLGLQFFDKRPIFGPSKTMRGIFVAVMVTPFAAQLLEINWFTGFLIGLYAMFGDLLSSFIKRRKGLDSGSMSIGLDPIPESLFPLLAVMTHFEFSPLEVLGIVVVFAIGELIFSRLLSYVHIRLHPY